MGLIIYLMRYGTLLHVLYPFFIFPVDSTFVVLLFGFRPEYNEISPHHAGFMKGTTKNENELICPPTRMLAININFIPVSCSARVKSIWETRTNVYCFDLLSQFNLIWIYCHMFSLYLLSFAVQQIQQKIECHCQVFPPFMIRSFSCLHLFVEISRLVRTQGEDLRQSALRYVNDNTDVLSDLYKAGGPLELVFEGPENIEIFLVKNNSS